MTTITAAELDELERALNRVRAASLEIQLLDVARGSEYSDEQADACRKLREATEGLAIEFYEYGPALIARIRELEAELDATEDTTKAVAKLAGAEVRIAELEGAVAAERERCAKIVEEGDGDVWLSETDAAHLARHIRAG